jgi:hypothetical protein
MRIVKVWSNIIMLDLGFPKYTLHTQSSFPSMPDTAEPPMLYATLL